MGSTATEIESGILTAIQDIETFAPFISGLVPQIGEITPFLPILSEVVTLAQNLQAGGQPIEQVIQTIGNALAQIGQSLNKTVPVTS